MEHSPYSCDLGPSNFHLFGLLKKHLAGKEFAADTNMKQAVTSWIQTIDEDCFYTGMQALMQ
jgi:hypothetical protein